MDLHTNSLIPSQQSIGVFSNRHEEKLGSSAFRFGFSSSDSLRAKPGDSRSRALRINRSNFSRRDRVGRNEGDDYYRFNLSRRTGVRISVENREFFLGPLLRFRLQRSSGSTIESETVRGNNEDTIRRRLDSGTYYIRVSSGGKSVPYRLRFRR